MKTKVGPSPNDPYVAHLQVPTPEPGALVVATWRDAWFDFDGNDDREDYLVRTVGFVVRVTDRFLVLAQEELPDEGWRALTWIPLAVLESWKARG